MGDSILHNPSIPIFQKLNNHLSIYIKTSSPDQLYVYSIAINNFPFVPIYQNLLSTDLVFYKSYYKYGRKHLSFKHSQIRCGGVSPF